MSFEAIEHEIVTWDEPQLRKLQALVATLRARRDDPAFSETMALRINDQTPEKWLTAEEFGRRLDLSENE